MEEIDIMISSDGSLRLTNFRIILTVELMTKEILLKDYLNCKIKISNIGHYKVRTIVLGVLTLLFLSPLLSSMIPATKKLDILDVMDMGLFIMSLAVSFLLTIFFIHSLTLHALSTRRYLEIDGRYGSILVPLSLWNTSARKFRKAIEKAKREMVYLINPE